MINMFTFAPFIPGSTPLLFYSLFVHAGTSSVAKELRSQVSQEQSGSVSQSLVHHPLTASIPESPTMKRGEYPFRRGE